MRAPTAAEQAVFGHDCKIGPDNKPIEQGIGAINNPNNTSHKEALARAKKLEEAQATNDPKALAAVFRDIIRADLSPEERAVQDKLDAAAAGEVATLKDKLTEQAEAIANLTKQLDALTSAQKDIAQTTGLDQF